jgi:hypothetical protein
MVSRIREQLGPAGFVIAIVALVAALGGGAYAASGGSSGGKATASAKGKPGPRGKTGKIGPAGPVGPAGPAGAAGLAGPAGPKGDPGAKGDPGTPGSPGAPGKGVVLTAITTAGLESNCVGTGGTKVEVSGEPATKKFVCNGETGFTETLPSEKTETGTWWFAGENTAEEVSPINFPIPLSAADAAAITVHIWRATAPDPECTGTPAAPTAEPGTFCLYIAPDASTIGGNPKVFTSDFAEEEAVGTTGAYLYYEHQAVGAHSGGSFAVTAP